MTPEQNKDIRLMLDMISKDLKRLSDDVKCLSQFMEIAAESECDRDSYCNCLKNIKMQEVK